MATFTTDWYSEYLFIYLFVCLFCLKAEGNKGHLHSSKVHKIQLQCHQPIVTVHRPKWNTTKIQLSIKIYTVQSVPKSSDKKNIL